MCALDAEFDATPACVNNFGQIRVNRPKEQALTAPPLDRRPARDDHWHDAVSLALLAFSRKCHSMRVRGRRSL